MKAAGKLACLTLVLAAVRCESDTGSPVEVPDATVASLEIVAPPSLLVNESALLTVTARNADGAEVPTPPQLLWASSDGAIARVGVGRAPVVTALRRGTVTVTASAGSVDASVSLSVKARVRIRRLNSPYLAAIVAVSESLQFAAYFIDVNGGAIDETPTVTWTSGNSDVVSVSPTGLAIGLQTGEATIIATNSDGRATMDITVTDVIVGLPAKVRLAHVAGGYGPLTFVPSQGASVTLSFGESIEVSIVSGTFRVLVEGLHQDAEGSWFIREGDHLEVFGTSWGVTGWWINEARLPADLGLVRFVQGTGPPNFALVVLLGTPGATVPESSLINCYFDPLVITDYVRVPAGEHDVIMGGKGLFLNQILARETARGRVTVAPGRAVTYVLAGDSPQTMRLLAFPAF